MFLYAIGTEISCAGQNIIKMTSSNLNTNICNILTDDSKLVVNTCIRGTYS